MRELRSESGAVAVDLIGRRTQRLADHRLRLDGRAEEAAGDARHLGPLLVVRARPRERRRGADALDVRRLAGVADPANEEGDVGTLPAAVGVQLVEHEVREALRRADERLVVRTREDVLEHHVVRQEDVRRMRADLLALLVVLLAGESPERHRAATVRIAVAEELAELLLLAIGQRVHRIHDDRGDPAPAAPSFPRPEDVVDDRHDVRKALARAGTGREDVVLTGARCTDGLGLVAVEPEWLPGAAGVGLLADAEDPAAFGVQEPLTDEVVDLTAGLERGVQLERRVGPQQALVEIMLDVLPDPLVLDRQE